MGDETRARIAKMLHAFDCEDRAEEGDTGALYAEWWEAGSADRAHYYAQADQLLDLVKREEVEPVECGCRIMAPSGGERVETFIGDGCDVFHPPDGEPTREPETEVVERLSEEEMASFLAYAQECATEPDGSQCQWADYTIRALATIHELQAERQEPVAQAWEVQDEKRGAFLTKDTQLVYHAKQAGIPVVEFFTSPRQGRDAGAMEALAAIRVYGSDTLSGRGDGHPVDVEWLQEGIREIVRRADTILRVENDAQAEQEQDDE